MLDQSQKAEQVILDLLQKGETPKLYCLLGDVKNQPSLYKKAWELSGGRYARAMRSLGSDYFRKSEWKACIESYSLALSINPLFESSW
jgi:tetratricopeptide (TPR) repeat protein